MLGVLTALLLFQLIGEALVIAFAWPVPGPVVGMALLFFTLVMRGSAPESLRTGAQNLLQHLSLFFVPAGAGVMLHFSRLGDEWLAILFALIISTALALMVTALIFRWLWSEDER